MSWACPCQTQAGLLRNPALIAQYKAGRASSPPLPPFTRLMNAAARLQVSKVANRSDEVISFQEQAVQQLRAPVTVKAIKAAIGELHLPEFLQQYA